MNILQHDPVTLFVCDFKFLVSNSVLSLTKSNLMKCLVWIDAVFTGKLFDILDRVSSWGKDEEDWRRVS